MKIKGISDYDVVNYKKPSLFIIFPKCSFKCDKECGMQVCQNSILANAECVETTYKSILSLYNSNELTHSFVFGGLEPFDSFTDMIGLVKYIREYTDDDIVIYTGYTEGEVSNEINELNKYKNIIVKFGRFIPNDEPHFDDVLGINLASHNQYAKKIS